MLRVLGALLLAGGAAAMGCSAAAGLTRRVRTLRSLLEALGLMEREISFQLTPMRTLLDRLAGWMPSPVGTFFACCRDGMEALGEKSLAQIWREALDSVPMGLEVRALETMAGLGDLLGRYDGAGQQEGLAQARALLAQDLQLAEEDREKRGRMYRALGLSAGALLVILLL